MRNAAIGVIGGGLLGASVAYHLAMRGAGDVTLLERMGLASAASSQAAGLLFQVSSKPAIDQLSGVTFSSIEKLEEQLGNSLDFHRIGTLRFAETDESRIALESMYARARQYGYAAEIVDENWRTKSLPWLRAEADMLSVFFPDDGFIDPYRLASAYAQAAKQSGVRIETGVAVKSIYFGKDGLVDLETSQGVFQCEKVVVAAGAWSNNLTMPLDISLPMTPTRSHFWMTAPDPMFSPNQPMMVNADAGIYTRPEAGGVLLGVQEAHSPTFDYRILPDDISGFPVTEDGREWDVLAEAEKRILDFFPAFNDVRFSSYMAGLSTYTPDGHFILGEIESQPGLYIATGCCGLGVTVSGGFGKAMAGLVLDGESPFDLVTFKPDRFGNVDPTSKEFNDRCAQARAWKAK